jgi:hypothetical protein
MCPAIKGRTASCPIKVGKLGLLFESSDDFAQTKPLMEMVRAERVFRASRQQPDIPAKPEAIRRLVEIGLKVKK